MITERTKANAIALLRLGDSPTKVSEDLELPYMLVKEWYEALGLTDLTRLEANTNALTRFAASEILNSSDQNVEILRNKIEETAIDIITEVRRTHMMGDIVYAKSLNLMADTCSKLYTSVVNRGKGAVDPNVALLTDVTLFDQLSKD